MIGILAGVPYWLTIIRRKEEEPILAWRTAHSFLVMDGLLMLIVGLMLPYLTLSELIARVLTRALVIAGYAFAVTFPVGAWKGYRGLTPRPYGLNTILFLGHVIGAIGSLIGIAIVIYGFLNAF